MSEKATLQSQLDELREELDQSQGSLAAAEEKAERYREERDQLRLEERKLKDEINNLQLALSNAKTALQEREDATRQPPGALSKALEEKIASQKRELERERLLKECEILRAVEAVRQQHAKYQERWLEQEEALKSKVHRLKQKLVEERAKEPAPIEHTDAPPTLEERTDSSTGPLESSTASGMPSLGMQQIPDLPAFGGEATEDAETVEDWLDRIEIVAAAFDWEKTKLAHLTSCLRGPALLFYRSGAEKVLPTLA